MKKKFCLHNLFEISYILFVLWMSLIEMSELNLILDYLNHLFFDNKLIS
jgi:hypothetical protein